MDKFVVRTPNQAQKKVIRQAGHKLNTIQLNCGNKGIAQSHYPKSMELRNYLSNAQPDIVLLQETWLHKKSTVSFPGYTVLRKDRPIVHHSPLAHLDAQHSLRTHSRPVSTEDQTK